LARSKTPSSALFNTMLLASEEQRLIALNHRLMNCEGEIPELISQMTVPYECSVCGGKVMLEHRIVVELHDIVGCPYCYDTRLVDDNNEYGPR
jgi:DNA-directed RNA polymerase subunit RPC12/RpoP